MTRGITTSGVLVLLGCTLAAADQVDVTKPIRTSPQPALQLNFDDGIRVDGWRDDGSANGLSLARRLEMRSRALSPMLGGDGDLQHDGYLQHDGDAVRGGGAAVQNARAFQLNFKESNCPFILDGDVEPINIVLLMWDSPTANPLGIDIILDDALITSLDDGSEYALALGVNVLLTLEQDVTPTMIWLLDVPAGVHTFVIEEGNEGTSSSIEIEVLDRQPMRDADNVLIERGPVAEDGLCAFVVSYENVCPVPDTYTLFVSGETLQGQGLSATFVDIPSYFTSVQISGAPPGFYNTQLRSFLPYNNDPAAEYFGCFVDADADPSTARLDPIAMNCDPSPCLIAPANFDVTQISYGGDDGPSVLLLLWTPGEIYSGGINLMVDEALAFDTDGDGVSFPTDEQGVLVGIELNTPAGEVTFGVQGDCGATGQTTITRTTFNVLAESPHPSPVDGVINCAWDNDKASTVSDWGTADCSTYIERFLLDDPLNNPDDQGTLVIQLDDFGNQTTRIIGNSTTDAVLDTEPDDRVEYKFYTWVNGDQHSSERVRCTTEAPTEYFIRGVCNDGSFPDVVNPQLTDGIFVLNFLFRGGPTPGCAEACDVNASGGLEITDGVHLFQFLFLAGPAPVGWGGQNPVCTVIEDGVDCELPSSNCPLQ